MNRVRLSHPRKILEGTKSESKGHEAECYRKDHLRDPGRNIHQRPIPHLNFVSNEFQCRIGQKATNGKGKKMGDQHDDIPSQRGQPSGNDIDVDMLFLLRGKGSPDKANPQDEISQERVPPIETRGEKVTEDDLEERDENHEAQESDDEGLFDFGNGLIGFFPSVHYFSPLR
jgi:hypothetical protein